MITPTGFELFWSNPPGANEYRVDIATVSDFSTMVPAYNDYHASGSSSGGFYVTGLTPGTDFYVRIRSYSTCGGTSANSSTLHITCSTPASPVATAATNVKTAQFTANWTAVSGASSYTVTLTRGGTSTTYPGLTGTSHTFTAVHPGSAYSYKVKAVSCSASTDSNSISLTTSALGVPVIWQVNGYNEEERFADWYAVDGADHYYIQIALNTTFTTLSEQGNVNGVHKDYDAIPCIYYYYVRVKAVAATGEESAYSTYWYDWPCDAARESARISPKDVVLQGESTDFVNPLVLYPNPAEKILTIGLPSSFHSETFGAETIDANGNRFVLPYQLSKAKATFDISGISAGVYLLTISDGKTIHRSKFLKK